jgi:hypothetical protein
MNRVQIERRHAASVSAGASLLPASSPTPGGARTAGSGWGNADWSRAEARAAAWQQLRD